MSTPTTTTPTDYRCRYCFIQLESRSLLKAHHLHHLHNNDVHTCYFCGLRIRRKDNYTTHLRVHIGELHWPCEFCGRSFLTSLNYSRHKCEILNCEFCGKYFNVGSRLQKHVLTVHNNINTCPVNCTVCRMGFTDLQQYERHAMGDDHIRRAEQLNNVSVSIFVKDSFEQEEEEQQWSSQPTVPTLPKLHKNGYKIVPPTSTKLYRCKICCKDFSTSKSHNVHLESKEHILQALKFKIKKVKDKLTRIQIKKSTHNRSQGSNSSSTPSIHTSSDPLIINYNKEGEAYSCQFCSKVCLTKPSLRCHIYTQHTAKESLKRWCEPCQKCISSPSKFRRHLESISHRLQIDSLRETSTTTLGIEPLTLSSNSAAAVPPLKWTPVINNNDNYGGPEKQKHACPTCGKIYGSKSSLSCHKHRHHRAKTKDLPPPPTRTYSYKLHKKHKLSKWDNKKEENNYSSSSIPIDTTTAKVPPIKIKAKHRVARKRKLDGLTHKCHICGKCYLDKHTLKHHMPSHTTRFQCSVCGKCLRDEYDLNKHVRTHGKYSDGQPHNNNQVFSFLNTTVSNSNPVI